MKISAILLAAGNSSRFEENKLVTLLKGKMIAQYAFDLVQNCGFNHIIVVTQYEAIRQLSKTYGYTCVVNDAPEKGISYSIQLALQHIINASDAVMFMVCDQPLLKKQTILKMLKTVDDIHILRCSYEGRKGNPAIFPKCYYTELLHLSSDIGGRAVMKKHPDKIKEIVVENEVELMDIDTQLQLEQLNKEC